ncbi:hypothetical protein GMRT_15798 [Giardia muris]|uniref:Nuclear factor related to kappa-B-binding protein second winged helix domain-containing protein n=1 Tax=Giardia muris TaxID=5742 RepID=A0A4Z1SWA6_GIAMU|nr:hypothetical protein GMRT_15798 [Giardia muris]|eukprot:TNJ29155.1 hypothetical protein GMRT_15798 [Giardia muris]
MYDKRLIIFERACMLQQLAELAGALDLVPNLQANVLHAWAPHTLPLPPAVLDALRLPQSIRELTIQESVAVPSLSSVLAALNLDHVLGALNTDSQPLYLPIRSLLSDANAHLPKLPQRVSSAVLLSPKPLQMTWTNPMTLRLSLGLPPLTTTPRTEKTSYWHRLLEENIAGLTIESEEHSNSNSQAYSLHPSNSDSCADLISLMSDYQTSQHTERKIATQAKLPQQLNPQAFLSSPHTSLSTLFIDLEKALRRDVCIPDAYRVETVRTGGSHAITHAVTGGIVHSDLPTADEVRELAPSVGKDRMESEVFGVRSPTYYEPLDLSSSSNESSEEHQELHSAIPIQSLSSIRTLAGIPVQQGPLSVVFSIERPKTTIAPDCDVHLDSYVVFLPVASFRSYTNLRLKHPSRTKSTQLVNSYYGQLLAMIPKNVGFLLLESYEARAENFTLLERRAQASGRSLRAELTEPLHPVDGVSLRGAPELSHSSKKDAPDASLQSALVTSEYVLNTQIVFLQGFMAGSSPSMRSRSLAYCPTLAHFLICLLAHQRNGVVLAEPFVAGSNDPALRCPNGTFNNTLAQEATDRRSALLNHILLSIQTTYPLVVQELIPPTLPVTEAVIICLNSLTSPAKDSVAELCQQCTPERQGQEISFISTESDFDLAGQTQSTVLGPPFHGVFETAREIIDSTMHGVGMQQNGGLEGELLRTEREPALKSGTIMAATRASTLTHLMTDPLLVGQARDEALAYYNKIFANSQIRIIPSPLHELQQIRAATIQPEENVLSGALMIPAHTHSGAVLVSRESDHVVVPFRTNHISFSASDVGQFVDSMVQPRKTDTAAVKTQAKMPTDIKPPVVSVPDLQQAILGIYSPALGEYRLLLSAEQDAYYGVPIPLMNASAYYAQYLLHNAAREYATLLQHSSSLLDQLERINTSSTASSARLLASQAGGAQASSTLGRYSRCNFGYTPIETAAFRAQERVRFLLLPSMPYTYVVRGHRVWVGPVLQQKQRTTRNASDSFIHPGSVPKHLTRAAIVRDALARLPGRFGTVADVIERCCESGFFFNQDDPKLAAGIIALVEKLRQTFYFREQGRYVCSMQCNGQVFAVVPGRLEALFDGKSVQTESKEREDYPLNISAVHTRI